MVPGWRRRYFRAPANQRLAAGVGASTPCGAVSNRENLSLSMIEPVGFGFPHRMDQEKLGLRLRVVGVVDL